MRRTTRRLTAARTAAPRTTLVLCAAALLTGLAAPVATADDGSPATGRAAAAAADKAAARPEVIDTLTRFFAQDGAGRAGAARAGAARGEPEVEAGAVPVRHLSPDFVAGRKGAPIAVPVFHASRAVAPDGREASLWTARHEGRWQVVNIATGDDETRYAALGERKLPGGTVFQEPQIGAWYVQRGDRVVPLDGQARRAVGADGATLAEYRAHVRRSYGDKLGGSAYAKSGKAGGYGAGAGAAGSAAEGARPADGAPARSAGTAPALRADAGATATSGALSVPVAVATGAAGVGLLALLLWAGSALRGRTAPVDRRP
ncbi:hypothetical protein JNUCC64_27085 [Streptomyces sp. JNUCC 64]